LVVICVMVADGVDTLVAVRVGVVCPDNTRDEDGVGDTVPVTSTLDRDEVIPDDVGDEEIDVVTDGDMVTSVVAPDGVKVLLDALGVDETSTVCTGVGVANAVPADDNESVDEPEREAERDVVAIGVPPTDVRPVAWALGDPLELALLVPVATAELPAVIELDTVAETDAEGDAVAPKVLPIVPSPVDPTEGKELVAGLLVSVTLRDGDGVVDTEGVEVT
jgi:hypothetical protein